MKVSVYCLVYNHEKYIKSALEGFIKQKTSFDYEVFVHDDFSTDGSAAIIKEYADRYPNIIKPIFQSDNKYSKNINIFRTYILPKITGEYIAICEGDDYWTDENKLQTQVDFLDTHPDYSACVHNSLKLDMRTNKTTVMYFHNSDEDICFLDVAKGGGSCYQTASLMYRACFAYNQPEFVIKHRGFGDFQLSMYLTLSGKMRFINNVMSVYRYGTESSWSKSNTEDLSKNAKCYRDLCNVLADVDEYTNFKYHAHLQKYINRWEYETLYFEENYKALRKEPYREMYLSMSRKYRLKTYIKQYFKWFYKLYRNIKYR